MRREGGMYRSEGRRWFGRKGVKELGGKACSKGEEEWEMKSVVK